MESWRVEDVGFCLKKTVGSVGQVDRQCFSWHAFLREKKKQKKFRFRCMYTSRKYAHIYISFTPLFTVSNEFIFDSMIQVVLSASFEARKCN